MVRLPARPSASLMLYGSALEGAGGCAGLQRGTNVSREGVCVWGRAVGRSRAAFMRATRRRDGTRALVAAPSPVPDVLGHSVASVNRAHTHRERQL